MNEPRPARDVVVDVLAHGAVDAGDRDRLLALATRDDAWSRDTLLHLTASALVVHPASRRVLLRWHDRMQAWLQLGGHGDPGESDPWAIAVREAREESGLDDLRPFPPGRSGPPRAVQIVIVAVPERGDEPGHEHADIRYVMATDRPDDATPETPGAVLRWLTLDEAEREVEPNVRVLVELARAGLDAV